MKKTSIHIRAVGDNLIHKEIYKAAHQSDGSYNFDMLFEHVKESIKEAEIAIINQETMLVNKETSYSSFPSFGTPVSIGDAISKAGFSVVTHASNHSMDKKREGLYDTYNYWKTYHPNILMQGISKKDKNKEFSLIEKNGIKVSFLNYTEKLNYRLPPIAGDYRVSMLKHWCKRKIKKQILDAKKASDIVVVLPHWGEEYLYEPVNSQKKWAEFFAECNVDIIIGTHPHVVQPVETLKRKDGKKMLVYYSLGNFVSYQVKKGCLLGGMADIIIEKNEDGCSIVSFGIKPLITHTSDKLDYFTTYFLEDYSEELLQENKSIKIASNKQGSKITYEDMQHLFSDILNKQAQANNPYKNSWDVKKSNIKGLFHSVRGTNAKK